jgi:hypothetical protein
MADATLSAMLDDLRSVIFTRMSKRPRPVSI